jgi:hypothetical protein
MFLPKKRLYAKKKSKSKIFFTNLHKSGVSGKNKTSKAGIACPSMQNHFKKAKRSFTMWKKFKESEFVRKMRQVRVNRAVYYSAVILLLTLAVILAVSAAMNRAKKPDVEGTPSITDTTPSDPKPTPDDSTETGADAKIPELGLPTSGKLAKKHSVDVQVFSQTMTMTVIPVVSHTVTLMLTFTKKYVGWKPSKSLKLL